GELVRRRAAGVLSERLPPARLGDLPAQRRIRAADTRREHAFVAWLAGVVTGHAGTRVPWPRGFRRSRRADRRRAGNRAVRLDEPGTAAAVPARPRADAVGGGGVAPVPRPSRAGHRIRAAARRGRPAVHPFLDAFRR